MRFSDCYDRNNFDHSIKLVRIFHFVYVKRVCIVLCSNMRPAYDVFTVHYRTSSFFFYDAWQKWKSAVQQIFPSDGQRPSSKTHFLIDSFVHQCVDWCVSVCVRNQSKTTQTNTLMWRERLKYIEAMSRWNTKRGDPKTPNHSSKWMLINGKAISYLCILCANISAHESGKSNSNNPYYDANALSHICESKIARKKKRERKSIEHNFWAKRGP